MTQSVVCGGCGAAVTYGRLSCPECGELLATVAGVGRRSMSSATSVAVAPEARSSLTSTVRAEAPPIQVTDPDDRLDEVMPLELPWTTPSDVAPPAEAPAAVAAVDHGLDAIMEAPVAPVAAVADAAVDPLDAAFPDLDDEPVPAWSDDPGEAFDDDVVAAASGLPFAAPATVASEPEAPAWPPAPVQTDGPAWPPAAASPEAPAWPPTPAPAPVVLPGAYVPPVPAQPAGTAAPARAWGGYAAEPVAAAAVAATASTNGHAPSGAAATGDPAAQSTGQVIDLTQANEFVGWLAVAGSMLAVVGFLLPWSNITVIGASGVGYLDRWGLAGPWHILVLLGVIGMLVAAILRDRVPAWAGIGLPGLGLGALLLGLVWPYLIGPLGGSLGAMAVALGAVMCVGAGIAALIVDRHARPDQPV